MKVLLITDSEIDICKRNGILMMDYGIGLCVNADYTPLFPHLKIIEIKFNDEGVIVWDSRVPAYISPRQGLIQLSRMGQLTIVENTIYNYATISGDQQAGQEAIIAWERASNWERGDVSVLLIASLLNWTDEMIDNFFIEAAKI